MFELEDRCDEKENSDDLSFAKQQLGSQQNESKVLGLPWDKDMDTLTVNFPKSETATTKREVLRNLAKVYDPLGLATQLPLQGKLIYQEICNHKVPWDAQLSKQLVKRVESWEQSLPTGATMPRSVVHYREPVAEIQLHAFGDASTQGVDAAVYAVIRQVEQRNVELQLKASWLNWDLQYHVLSWSLPTWQ